MSECIAIEAVPRSLISLRPGSAARARRPCLKGVLPKPACGARLMWSAAAEGVRRFIRTIDDAALAHRGADAA